MVASLSESGLIDLMVGRVASKLSGAGIIGVIKILRSSMKSRLVWLVVAFSFILSFLSFAQTPSFTPDKAFKGSNLNDWQSIGDAKWSAANGEINADGKNSKGAGWLFLNQSSQDTGVYVSFKCDGACDTGVLFRAEEHTSELQSPYVISYAVFF